jgi:hypothetical protein
MRLVQIRTVCFTITVSKKKGKQRLNIDLAKHVAPASRGPSRPASVTRFAEAERHESLQATKEGNME